MSNEYELNPAERELEKALCGLKPVPLKGERDRLMFRAGQASAERKTAFWPSLSVFFAVMSLVSWTIQLQPDHRPPSPTAAGPVKMAQSDFSRPESTTNPPLAMEQEAAGEFFWQWRKPGIKRSLDNLTQAQFGFHSGGVEVWRPFKPAVSDEFETRM
jgi:hypothetical protein